MLVACKNITSNILHNKIKDLFGLIFCNFFFFFTSKLCGSNNTVIN